MKVWRISGLCSASSTDINLTWQEDIAAKTIEEAIKEIQAFNNTGASYQFDKNPRITKVELIAEPVN